MALLGSVDKRLWICDGSINRGVITALVKWADKVICFDRWVARCLSNLAQTEFVFDTLNIEFMRRPFGKKMMESIIEGVMSTDKDLGQHMSRGLDVFFRLDLDKTPVVKRIIKQVAGRRIER